MGSYFFASDSFSGCAYLIRVCVDGPLSRANVCYCSCLSTAS